MPTQTIIAKNPGAQDVLLLKLGVTISAGGSFKLSEFFDLTELWSATDLIEAIGTEKIFLNDGVNDLNKEQSLLFITSPWPNRNLDPQGNPIVAPTFLYIAETAKLQGERWTALAGQVNIFDVEVVTELRIQGGQFWIKGFADGDTADFSIVDKNDVLGLFSGLGLVVGQDVLELRKFVSDYALPPPDTNKDLWKDEIIMPSAAPVKRGLFMRCVYKSVGQNDVQMGVLYRWYEDSYA